MTPSSPTITTFWSALVRERSTIDLIAPATRFLAKGQSKWTSACALKKLTHGSAPTSTTTPATSDRLARAANLLLIAVLASLGAEPSHRLRSVKMIVL